VSRPVKELQAKLEERYDEALVERLRAELSPRGPRRGSKRRSASIAMNGSDGGARFAPQVVADQCRA